MEDAVDRARLAGGLIAWHCSASGTGGSSHAAERQRTPSASSAQVIISRALLGWLSTRTTVGVCPNRVLDEFVDAVTDPATWEMRSTTSR